MVLVALDELEVILTQIPMLLKMTHTDAYCISRRYKEERRVCCKSKCFNFNRVHVLLSSLKSSGRRGSQSFLILERHLFPNTLFTRADSKNHCSGLSFASAQANFGAGES